jgi:hypothetical protein
MKKKLDPKDTYVVRDMFGCGEGHFLTPGFTHWESGEACPHGHSESANNADVHLYWRKALVPTNVGTKENPYDTNTKTYDELFAEKPGTWVHLPLAE